LLKLKPFCSLHEVAEDLPMDAAGTDPDEGTPAKPQVTGHGPLHTCHDHECESSMGTQY